MTDRQTEAENETEDRPTVRVLLAAHGEAETAGIVENFRISWHTLAHAAEVMRLPVLLRLLICSFAAIRKRLSGRSGSPHNDYSRGQAEALEGRLNEGSGARYRVEAVFASAPPYLETAVAMDNGVDRQVIVNMIPTDSRLSCGLGCHALLAASEDRDSAVIARFWDSEELVAVHRDHIIRHYPPELVGQDQCLVLVLHGTVIRDEHGAVPDFHTGEAEKSAYAAALRDALLAVPDRSWQRIEIAYLNHGVGGEWSSPTLEALLEVLASEGVEATVVYPCEHLVDGGETQELPSVLEASGLAKTHCLPCLNVSPGLIDLLAARVRQVESAQQSRYLCDACPLRNGNGGTA